MTTGYFSSVNQSGVIVSNNYDVYIAPNVALVSTDTNSYANTGYGTITNYGALIGSIYSVSMQTGGTASPSVLFNAAGAIISAPSLALYVGAGGINITNNGEIGGTAYQGIAIQAGAAADVVSIVNTGTIEGSSIAYQGNVGKDQIVNSGVFRGSVQLSSGGGTFDSSLGQVLGTVTAGAGGDTIIAGQNGGTVVGVAGNDNLQANRSQLAADNHVQFTLDGAGGSNALYGGGAFTTFFAGDAGGGHNQIHGGFSLMGDVAGYANNTIDFSKTPSGKSAYVDLLSGHNAYLYATATHSGALTFEDSIQNVPDVIGSAGGDLIRADNGTDIIQGGAGGDILYAGTGVDTFVYKGYADSNTVHGYDTISGFATSKDKLDLSALNSDASHLAIASSSSSTTLYLEKTAGTFNSATDLAISFTGAHAIAASDVIF